MVSAVSMNKIQMKVTVVLKDLMTRGFCMQSSAFAQALACTNQMRQVLLHFCCHLMILTDTRHFIIASLFSVEAHAENRRKLPGDMRPEVPGPRDLGTSASFASLRVAARIQSTYTMAGALRSLILTKLGDNLLNGWLNLSRKLVSLFRYI